MARGGGVLKPFVLAVTGLSFASHRESTSGRGLFSSPPGRVRTLCGRSATDRVASIAHCTAGVKSLTCQTDEQRQTRCARERPPAWTENIATRRDTVGKRLGPAGCASVWGIMSRGQWTSEGKLII